MRSFLIEMNWSYYAIKVSSAVRTCRWVPKIPFQPISFRFCTGREPKRDGNQPIMQILYHSLAVIMFGHVSVVSPGDFRCYLLGTLQRRFHIHPYNEFPTSSAHNTKPTQKQRSYATVRAFRSPMQIEILMGHIHAFNQFVWNLYKAS